MAAIYASVSGFLERRRRPLGILAAVAGGAYVVASYAKSKLDDLQEGLGRTRASRENLRRRFQQNQEDCGFTVLALLPSLGTQILEKMDVEALTARLSAMGKPKPKPVEAPVEAEPAQDAKVEEGAEVVPEGVNGDSAGVEEEKEEKEEKEEGPNSLSSSSTLDPKAKPFTFSPAVAPVVPQDPEPSSPPPPSTPPRATAPSPTSPTLAQTNGALSPVESHDPDTLRSIPSTDDLSEHQKEAVPQVASNGFLKLGEESTVLSGEPQMSAFLPVRAANGFEALDVTPPAVGGVEEPVAAKNEASGVNGKGEEKAEGLEGMTKSEVWNEIKILSFSRLLMSVYALALLTLQTHVQLNLLGRYAYVSSVLAMASEDPSLPPALQAEEQEGRLRNVDLRTERRYLTFSWWFLHRGWEVVAERVRGK